MRNKVNCIYFAAYFSNISLYFAPTPVNLIDSIKKCKSITVENIQIEHLNVINNDNQWPYSCTPGGLK